MRVLLSAALSAVLPTAALAEAPEEIPGCSVSTSVEAWELGEDERPLGATGPVYAIEVTLGVEQPEAAVPLFYTVEPGKPLQTSVATLGGGSDLAAAIRLAVEPDASAFAYAIELSRDGESCGAHRASVSLRPTREARVGRSSSAKPTPRVGVSEGPPRVADASSLPECTMLILDAPDVDPAMHRPVDEPIDPEAVREADCR